MCQSLHRGRADGVSPDLVGTHLTQDHAREFVLDHFRRAVAADLDMLKVRAT